MNFSLQGRPMADAGNHLPFTEEVPVSFLC